MAQKSRRWYDLRGGSTACFVCAAGAASPVRARGRGKEKFMGFWELMFSKSVSIGLVLLLFAAIIFFLRRLYGPGGRFRDPEWDRWNEEARRKEEAGRKEKAERGSRLAAGSRSAEAAELQVSEAAARREGPRFTAPAGLEQRFVDDFFSYSREFVSADPLVNAHLALKEAHTGRVLANAAAIAEAEPAFADAFLRRALLVAALFHDVGRFAQFSRWQTFSDAHSCNHGTLGAKTIRARGFLDAEPPALRQVVLAAVAVHNRLGVPAAVSGPLLPVLLAVRDADKVDILRIMAENLGPGAVPDKTVLLHLSDEPAAFSPAVLDAFERGRTALYRDMRFYNDFRILLCTWLHDLRFAASFALVREQGHLDTVIDGLASLPGIQAKARRMVKEKFAGAPPPPPLPD